MASSIIPDLRDIFAYIDDHSEIFLSRLLDYLRHPSISAYGEGIGEVAEYMAGVMSQMGLAVQILSTEGLLSQTANAADDLAIPKGNAARASSSAQPFGSEALASLRPSARKGWPMVFGERHVKPDAPTVLLYGHYDVQPPDPLEEWLSPPFEPAIRDGRIYARGVADNKGQHFAQLMALESLLACNGTLPCNVKVLLEGEEEVGSPHMLAFIRAHRDRLAADLMIVSDGPVHENGQSMISFGVRGVLDIELRARGANRDLHSGHWGGIAPNPLWTLVHLLASMKNERGEVTIDGFYENVQPLTEMEREALASLPINVDEVQQALDLRYFDEPRERNFFERQAAWPTLTINGIHGGYGGPGSKTVLPHEAIAKCDIRLVEAQTAQEILTKVKAHVQRHAPDVIVTSHGGMDPSKTPLDNLYTEPLRQAITAAQGAAPLLVPAKGASLPNYVFTKILGIPVFCVPYANADEANHAPNENMEVARFFMGIKTGVAMLSYLGAMSKERS